MCRCWSPLRQPSSRSRCRASAAPSPGAPGAGDPYFPTPGQRRLRRAQLSAADRVHAVRRAAGGHGTHRRGGDEGPLALRPRPAAQSAGQCGDRQRRRGDVGATGEHRAGTRDHPGRGDRRRCVLRRRCHLRGHGKARHRPGRLARRLHPDRRRRIRRQRAAGLAVVVPGERHPDRQGALRRVDDGADRAGRGRQRHAALDDPSRDDDDVALGARPPGVVATWSPRRSGSSTCTWARHPAACRTRSPSTPRSATARS